MVKRQKSSKLLLSLGAFGVIAILAISMVFAYQGDYSVKGPNYSEDRHEAMEQAFEDLDYETWYDLMTQDGRHPRVVDVVTEDNFATFVEAHEAAEAGDLETAKQLRSELGLNNGQGPKDGSGHRNGYQNNQGSRMGQGKGSDLRGRWNCPYTTSE